MLCLLFQAGARCGLCQPRSADPAQDGQLACRQLRQVGRGVALTISCASQPDPSTVLPQETSQGSTASFSQKPDAVASWGGGAHVNSQEGPRPCEQQHLWVPGRQGRALGLRGLPYQVPGSLWWVSGFLPGLMKMLQN